MSEEKKKIIELNYEELNIVNAGKGGGEQATCPFKNEYDECPVTNSSFRPGSLNDCATCRSTIVK